jgi:hypothetical protein
MRAFPNEKWKIGEVKLNPFFFLLTILMLPVISSLIAHGSDNQSAEHQGSSTAEIGEDTGTCPYYDFSSNCDNMFDSPYSVHIGEHDMDGNDDPFAIFDIPLGGTVEQCVGEMEVKMRYQVNDIYHGSGGDHDIFVHLKDHSSGGWDLLDSTVDESTSNPVGDYTFGGTLDYGGSGNGNHGHGSNLVEDETRPFNRTHIVDADGTTMNTGDYLDAGASSLNSELKLKISSNPDSNHETRVEIDWIRIYYDYETQPPSSPENPSFTWRDANGGQIGEFPLQNGGVVWNNFANASMLQIDFEQGGFDECGFSGIQYGWRESYLENPPTGTSMNPLPFIIASDSGNSIFSSVQAPPSGEWKFWWRGVDENTNFGDWEFERVNFDFENPSQPSITVPSQNNWFGPQDAPINLVWLASTDSHSGVEKYWVNSSGNALYSEEVSAYSMTSQYVAIQGDSLLSGENQFTVTALDGGFPIRNSQSSSIHSILYDDMAPSAFAPFPNGTLFINQEPVYDSGPLGLEPLWESGISQCEALIDGSQSIVINQSLCENGGDLAFPQLDDGWHSILIEACDEVENCNYSETRSFVVDSEAPSLVLSQIQPSTGGWSNGSLISVNASFSDWDGVWNGTGVDRIWSVFLEEGVAANTTLIKSIGEFDECVGECTNLSIHHSRNVSSGIWKWWFVTKDTSGNERIGNVSEVAMIDNSRPRFDSQATHTFDSNGTLNGTWATSDDHSGISHHIVVIDSCDFSNGTTVLGESITVNNLDDGSHFICVKAIDFVGNSRVSISGASTLDTTIPNLTITSNVPTSWVNGQQLTISWSADDENGIQDVSITSDLGFSVSGLPASGSQVMSSLISGSHNISIIAIDSYGNQNLTGFTLQIDNRPPSITHISIENGSWWQTSPHISLSWSFIEQHSGIEGVEILLEGLSFVDIEAYATSTVLTLPDGEHNITLRVVDVAGNSASLTARARIDTSIPNCHLGIGSGNWVSSIPEFEAWVTSNGGSSPISWNLTIGDSILVEPDLQDIDIRFLGDGVTQFKLEVWNAAATGSICEGVMRIDREAPTFIELDSLVLTKDTSISMSFRAIDHYSGFGAVTVSIENMEMWNMTSQNGSQTVFGDVSVELPPYDGIYRADWLLTDLAGNSRSVESEIILDSEGPKINHLYAESPVSAYWLPTESPKLFWNIWDEIDDGPIVEVWLDGISIGTGFEGNRYGRSLNESFGNGHHSIRIRATDHLGNYAEESIFFGIDSAQPTCLVSSLHKDKWTSVIRHHLEVHYTTGPSGGEISIPHSNAGTWQVSGMGMVSTSIDLLEGEQTVEVWLTSGSGRVTNCHAALKVDTIRPSISVLEISSTNGGDTFGDGNVEIDWFIGPENDTSSPREMAILFNGVQIFPPDGVKEYESDNGSKETKTVYHRLSREGGNGSITHKAPRDGQYTIVAVIRDEAGNYWESSPEEISVQLDEFHPTIECLVIGSPSPGGQADLTMAEDAEFSEIQKLVCEVGDDSPIDPFESIVRITLDGNDIKEHVQRVIDPPGFSVAAFGSLVQEIGEHQFSVLVEDEWGRLAEIDVSWRLRGKGVTIDGDDSPLEISRARVEELLSGYHIILEGVDSDSTRILPPNEELFHFDVTDSDRRQNRVRLNIGSELREMLKTGDEIKIEFRIEDGSRVSTIEILFEAEENPGIGKIASDALTNPIISGASIVAIIALVIKLRKRNEFGWLDRRSAHYSDQKMIVTELSSEFDELIESNMEDIGALKEKMWPSLRHLFESEFSDRRSLTKSDVRKMRRIMKIQVAREWETIAGVLDSSDDGIYNDSIGYEVLSLSAKQSIVEGRSLDEILEDYLDDNELNYSNEEE